MSEPSAQPEILPPEVPTAPPAGGLPPGVANRRNLYRVLHVQPEAPFEVIQASYRTLMLRLRQHPDLGGDHEQAALVNAAWAVLSDPQRRADYDRLMRRQTQAARLYHGAGALGVGRGAPSELTRPLPPGSSTDGGAHLACPLCGQTHLLRPRPDSRCGRCNAPLAPLPAPGQHGHELFGRRDAVRRDQDHVATLHVGWPSPPLAVRWRDLSLSGLSVYTAQPVPEGARVHIIDSALEAVAEVVGCRPQGNVHVVHARLLTAVPLQSTGVFMSARA